MPEKFTAWGHVTGTDRSLRLYICVCFSAECPLHFSAVINMIGEWRVDRNTGWNGADEAIHPAVEPLWRLSSATSWHPLSLSLLQLSSAMAVRVLVCIREAKRGIRSFKEHSLNKVDYTFIKATASCSPAPLDPSKWRLDEAYSAFRAHGVDYPWIAG